MKCFSTPPNTYPFVSFFYANKESFSVEFMRSMSSMWLKTLLVCDEK